jgi:hypothetical protein
VERLFVWRHGACAHLAACWMKTFNCTKLQAVRERRGVSVWRQICFENGHLCLGIRDVNGRLTSKAFYEIAIHLRRQSFEETNPNQGAIHSSIWVRHQDRSTFFQPVIDSLGAFSEIYQVDSFARTEQPPGTAPPQSLFPGFWKWNVSL